MENWGENVRLSHLSQVPLIVTLTLRIYYEAEW
jgi:hypothetical protein